MATKISTLPCLKLEGGLPPSDILPESSIAVLTVDGHPKSCISALSNAVVCSALVQASIIFSDIADIHSLPSFDEWFTLPDPCPRDVGCGISWSVAVGRQRARLIDGLIPGLDVQFGRDCEAWFGGSTKGEQIVEVAAGQILTTETGKQWAIYSSWEEMLLAHHRPFPIRNGLLQFLWGHYAH